MTKLVTSYPIALADNQATPVTHNFTFHHQLVSEDLASTFASDEATGDNPESLKISYQKTKAGRKRSLAQIAFYRNTGTTETPVWEPYVFNISTSVPKNSEHQDITDGLQMLNSLLNQPGFLDGFASRYIE